VETQTKLVAGWSHDISQIGQAKIKQPRLGAKLLTKLSYVLTIIIIFDA